MKIFVMIGKHFAKTMINLKTMKCFMSQNFVCRKKIICRKKNENIYKLINVNETIIEQKNWMIEKTISLLMTIQQYHEKIIFDIVSMTRHDVLLKISWLKKHNPDVNWKKIFIWKKHQSMKMLSTHWKHTMIDEISSFKKTAKRKIAISTKKNDFKRKKSDFTNTNQKKAGHEVKNTKKHHAIFKNSLKRQKKEEIPVISNVYKK